MEGDRENLVCSSSGKECLDGRRWGKAFHCFVQQSNEGITGKLKSDPLQRCVVVGSNGLRL